MYCGIGNITIILLNRNKICIHILFRFRTTPLKQNANIYKRKENSKELMIVPFYCIIKRLICIFIL